MLSNFVENDEELLFEGLQDLFFYSFICLFTYLGYC